MFRIAHRALPGLILAVLAILGGCDATSQLNCELSAIANLQIEVRRKLLTVPVTIEGQQVRLIVDTGAERTTLSETTVTRLNLARDMKRINSAQGMGGTTSGADAIVSNFVLGNKRFQDVTRIAVGRFGFEGSDDPVSDGVLGADILLAFDLDIDVPGRALTLYRSRICIDNAPPWQEPFVEIQGVTARKDRLLIPFHLDGHVGKAILDTGATLTTIGVQMANRMGLDDRAMALDRKVRQTGIGAGTTIAHYHWFRELRVGPALKSGVMLTVLSTDAGVGDALIGEDFLEGRRMWMASKTRQVFVSKLAHETAAR